MDSVNAKAGSWDLDSTFVTMPRHEAQSHPIAKSDYGPDVTDSSMPRPVREGAGVTRPASGSPSMRQ